MRDAARHFLKSFEALSDAAQREVLEELFRRAAEHPYSFSSKKGLSRAAGEPRQKSLLGLAGSGKGLWGRDSAKTLRKLRDETER